jgi:hypothetical protein
MIYDLTCVIEDFLRTHNEPPISLRDQRLARKKKERELELEEVSYNFRPPSHLFFPFLHLFLRFSIQLLPSFSLEIQQRKSLEAKEAKLNYQIEQEMKKNERTLIIRKKMQTGKGEKGGKGMKGRDSPKEVDLKKTSVDSKAFQWDSSDLYSSVYVGRAKEWVGRRWKDEKGRVEGEEEGGH